MAIYNETLKIDAGYFMYFSIVCGFIKLQSMESAKNDE